MFGLRKKNKEPKPASTMPSFSSRRDASPSVIAAGMNVLGNIISDGPLDIDGQVDGNVRAGSVTVRSNGRIRGDVVADDVYVYGIIDGLVKAVNVTFYEGAQVSGTVMHESLTVEDGAEVDCKLKRTERVVLEDDGEKLRRSVPPIVDSEFVNDNDEPQSEAEIRVLENLRLIS